MGGGVTKIDFIDLPIPEARELHDTYFEWTGAPCLHCGYGPVAVYFFYQHMGATFTSRTWAGLRLKETTKPVRSRVDIGTRCAWCQAVTNA